MKILNLTNLYSYIKWGSLCLILGITQFAKGNELGDKWQLLGSRTVKFALDKDEILVTAAEGFFDAIKIKVKNSGINMHKCVVHYGDGSTQEIELKNQFKQGDESRVIDLEGNDRVIRKVVFWYDTKNYRKRPAMVELWGRNLRR